MLTDEIFRRNHRHIQNILSNEMFGNKMQQRNGNIIATMNKGSEAQLKSNIRQEKCNSNITTIVKMLN